MNPRLLLVVLMLVVPAKAQGGITSLSPTSVNAGAPAFTLAVNGGGFASGNVVQWDGSNIPTTFVSASQLTASVSAALVATGGAHNVRVKQALISNNFSNTVVFNVNHPVPALSGISPTVVLAGSPGFTLTATGTNFDSASVIRWNGVTQPTTFVSSTSLQAAIAAATFASAASVNVTVTTPAPGGGTTAAQTLQVNNPIPTVATVSPLGVFAGGPAFTLTVNGTNFNSTSTIRFDATPMPTTLVSPTQLTTTITAAMIATIGFHNIDVVNPGPGGGTSFTATLFVQYPVPAIAALTPSSITGGGADAVLTILGVGFIPAAGPIPGTVVEASGTPLVMTSVTSNQIGAILPASLLHATASLTIKVTNSYPALPLAGGGSSSSALLVIGPAIIAVSPAIVPVLSAGSLPIPFTVSGGPYQAGDSIRINGATRPTALVNAATLSCTLDGTVAPTLQPGGFAVTVTRQGTAGLVVSNAAPVTVGAAGFPDNAGTVTFGPVPPVPGDTVDIRVELPIAQVPVTLIVDTAAPPPTIFNLASGVDFVVGPGLGSPILIFDGLGIFGPPTFGALVPSEDLTPFGVPLPRGLFRTSAITLPPFPLGLTYSLAAIYGDPSSPVGFRLTHVSGPYSI